MTRKDYILIADAIKEVWNIRPDAEDPIMEIVFSLCRVLQRDNDRFNRSTFIAACRKLKD